MIELVQAPRPKMKLILRRMDRPLVDPPGRCVVCEELRESHQFPHRRDGRSPVCFFCHRLDRRQGKRRLPWDADVSWSDHVAYDDAGLVLHLLETEIEHARHARI